MVLIPRKNSVQTALFCCSHLSDFTVFMPCDPKLYECLLARRYIFHRSSNHNQAFICTSVNGVVDVNKQC